MATHLIGRYIVTDPGVCHGKPTFRSTRILVADVLEQIANGMAWETVIQEWHGAFPGRHHRGAPTGNPALLDHVDDYVLRSA